METRHLLSINDLSEGDINLILDTAEGFRGVLERDIKKVPALRGKTVVNLFYEPSTRTRTSFELAAKRLSTDVINFSVSTSSVVKGESLIDTAMTIQALGADFVVVRHSCSGASHLLARHLEASIINAGDGVNEHPTQALLDAFTVR
ncbi:MAG TPA: aspartate carbamoyltransferase, partial [Nitrospirae bacterium]|nr:aspartate carbamoyltransferase [Nitrospirota bacterium]